MNIYFIGFLRWQHAIAHAIQLTVDVTMVTHDNSSNENSRRKKKVGYSGHRD